LSHDRRITLNSISIELPDLQDFGRAFAETSDAKIAGTDGFPT
jgi:hypothetical protein